MNIPNLRLTNEMREGIILKALDFTFGAQRKADEIAKTVLADAIYAHYYGPVLHLTKQLGEVWVEKADTLSLICRDWSHGDIRMSSALPQPFGRWSAESVKVAEDSPMYEQVVKLEKLLDKHDEQELELRRSLGGLLRSVNTVKRLREVWPEGSAFIPTIAPVYAVVPVTLTHEINRMMGLEPVPNAAKEAIAKAAA